MRTPLRQILRDTRTIDGLSFTVGAALTFFVWLAWFQPGEPVGVHSVCHKPAHVPPTPAVFVFSSEAQ